MIDTLTHELEGKFGVGQAATPLMRELLQMMTAAPGGLAAFLDRFRSAGAGPEVASFVGGKSEAPLPAATVDNALGKSTVAGIAERVGIAPTVAATALGFEIPKVIGLMTPGGTVPATPPSEVKEFLASTDQVSPARTNARRLERQGEPTVRDTGLSVWLWVMAAGLLALGLLLWVVTHQRT
jgi:uncharacterized protein YidB (DUF937 family)